MNTASSPSTASGVQVRHLDTLAEFEACMQVESAVWGESDNLVPSSIFVVAHHTGGQVLGAYDGEKLVGFTLAMAGVRDSPFLHSHMTAVLPEYRDRGVGRALKLAQREDALARGIERVEWTFDPLELKNAHFNLERLGAIARQYLPNVYGITTSPLHAGLPTDRLVAEWWLASPRAVRCAAGRPLAAGVGAQHAAPAPAGRRGQPLRISVPANIGELKSAKPAEAVAVQAKLREQFTQHFAKGYAVTGFQMAGDKAEYLLEPLADPQGAA